MAYFRISASQGTGTLTRITTGGYGTYATEPGDLIFVEYCGSRWGSFSGAYTQLWNGYYDFDGNSKAGAYLLQATGTSVSVVYPGGTNLYIACVQYRYE